MLKKNFYFCCVIASTFAIASCASTPALPPFADFADYPTEDNKLVFLTSMSGRGVQYITTCVITNPADIEAVKSLDYSNTAADSVLSLWEEKYNAVSFASNMGILRADIAAFNLPESVNSIAMLFVGGSDGHYHTVAFYELPLSNEKRQAYDFVLNAKSPEPEVSKVSYEQFEKTYKTLHRRYAWQKFPGQKPQLGFIVK